MRETITGTLCSYRIPKSYGGLLADLLAAALEEDGLLEGRYYPPTYWIETERRDYTGHRAYMYRFRGQPKAFNYDMAGATVTVTAQLDDWQNGIGTHLVRPRVVSIDQERDA